MFSFDVDARLQTTAGIALLQASKLVRLDGEKFVAANHLEFESAWPKSLPVFGRLRAWIDFAAGAEMFAKGLCLLHEVEIRRAQEVPNYPPTSQIQKWAASYVSGWDSDGLHQVVHYGTLGNLVNSGLPRLLEKVSATDFERTIILAAYDFLTRTIRNRDAHSYQPNVRDQHFHLVAKRFVPALTTLLSWLPGGGATAELWLAEADDFVRNL